MQPVNWLKPDWNAPAHVRAVCTTRQGGHSRGAYESMNPALHVGDAESTVMSNRAVIEETLGLHHSLNWLDQYHSNFITDLDGENTQLRADGSTTAIAEKACVVMTADCLPVLLTDREGVRVAAVHVGWRGLADGILENGVSLFDGKSDVLAWMGPAIGPEKFEVGEEVVDQLGIEGTDRRVWCKKSDKQGKWLINLYELAAERLKWSGVSEVSGGGYCTFMDDQRFFSYRRQGQTGRMASVVWIASLQNQVYGEQI